MAYTVQAMSTKWSVKTGRYLIQKKYFGNKYMKPDLTVKIGKLKLKNPRRNRGSCRNYGRFRRIIRIWAEVFFGSAERQNPAILAYYHCRLCGKFAGGSAAGSDASLADGGCTDDNRENRKVDSNARPRCDAFARDGDCRQGMGIWDSRGDGPNRRNDRAGDCYDCSCD